MTDLAEDLISRSIQRREIVHAAWTDELDSELILLADDHAHGEDVIEFWGASWRVHLDLKP